MQDGNNFNIIIPFVAFLLSVLSHLLFNTCGAIQIRKIILPKV